MTISLFTHCPTRLLKRIPLALIAASMLTTASYASETEPSGYQLEKVVILSRHGVRAPTKMTQTMRDVTPNAWPEWPVKLGYITPRGEHLVSLMGGFYRQKFQQLGILSKDRCPTANDVYVWADVDQRTRKTGEAFLAGLAPECHLSIHHQQDIKQADPLFHPVKAGVCTMEKTQVQQAVEQQAGMPIDQLNQHYRPALALMSSVLNFPKSTYCQQHSADQTCDLAQAMPSKLSIKDNGNKVALDGAVGLSSTLAEIFLLEYAQGMPDAAWGKIHSEQDWNALLTLHNAQFDLMSRTPYIAKHNGTPLLQTIVSAINSQPSSRELPELSADNKILFLAGHDTNIANIAGMFGMSWALPGQPDNTPPGGALVFERWSDKTGKKYVSVQMMYQTLAQLRNQTPLTLDKPAGSVALKIPGCDDQTAEGYCPLDTFTRLAKQNELVECQ
ncbi:AppA family phytase/histidine-type acid phosphatase [Hafnia alvei]|uniref:AppA family phytase/histidine-type acid phosphatase n=1 Tax=Hafnia alvei TaxID=569 RepID=A0ABD7Q0A1_HAFAL|nr:AppA family phytase/histidine-type acid phosphatase [Hafnia alvei]TBL66113.1 AppA family phytase/histidine-type acid phosphatase [Hafnia alvei]